MQLLDWQVQAAQRQFEILKERGRAINSSSTGIGKTFLAADTAVRLGLPVLVICPKSILSSWREILADAGVKKFDVMNAERLKTSKHGFWNKTKWEFNEERFIIWDEAHAGLVGPQSQTTAMAAKLKAFTTMPKLFMSATIADSPLQLRALGFLFDLHGYVEPDFYGWCLRMGCERAQMPDGRGGFVTVIQMPRAKYRAELVMLKLREMLAPYTVRLTPENAPGFPETVIESRLVDLDTASTAEIRKLYETYANAHSTRSLDPRAQLIVARQRTEVAKVPVLLEMAKEIESEGRSVVVFLNFHDSMDRMAAELGSHNVVQIRGEQNDTQRQEAISDFQSNKKHFCLAQSQAGGIAVSLHDVTKTRPRSSLICPDWSASRTVQCLGRIRRTGGTATIQTFILAAGTLEERVYRALNRKIRHIELLNDGDLTIGAK